MKTTLLYATSIFFLLGTSFAHEVATSPVVVTHRLIVEHRIVQLNEKVGARCRTSYITISDDGEKSAQRKSVDCDE